MNKQVTIAISTIFQNGGDATRALEIAKIIRQYKPRNKQLRIVFLSRGSQYERLVEREGFEIHPTLPILGGIRYQDDFETRFGELIGNEFLALEILQGEIQALHSIRPNLLIYGFWPIESVAARLSMPQLKTIAFLPLPLTEAFLREQLTFPDEIFLAKLPTCFQQVLMQIIPHTLKRKSPALRHTCIQKAAIKAGWKGEPLDNIFDMLRSDAYLINDLPLFYQTKNYPQELVFTGPVYAMSKEETIDDPMIQELLSDKNPRKKIFCTLGTSGDVKLLLEVIKMLNSKEGMTYSAILLSPPSVCPINKVRDMLRNPYVYATDRFVPAKRINELADIVICHGGQGTLQTAIMSGTPLIGVATQPEQKINLEHLTQYGVAIRIPIFDWNEKQIGKAVKKIVDNEKQFKRSVSDLRKEYININVAEEIGTHIWAYL